MMAPCLVCRKKFDPSELLEVKGVTMCGPCMAKAMNAPPAPASSLSEPEPIEAPAPVPETQPEGQPLALKTGRELQAMNIVVEWLIAGLVPRCSVILLYGRGGIGKTTLMMMLANAIDRALMIFGMATVKVPVIVIDFENSLAVLSERAKRTGVDGVLFLDSSANPPHLDRPDWTFYLDLLKQYPGALFVFDTLRSSHSGDENDSRTMSLIMSRMRQLRDAGATVVLLHHTPKGNDRQFKGSGAIFDLCDQTLALYQTAKPGSEQEADDDDDAPDKVYRFGTGKKTRYKPHRVFLTFDAEREVFTLAQNPDDEALDVLHSIITDMSVVGCAKQTEIVKRAAEYDLGGDKKILSFLRKGVGSRWTTEKGLHNSTIYRPIQFGSLAPPYRGEKLKNWNNEVKTDVYEGSGSGGVAKLNQSGNADGKTDFQSSQQSPIKPEFASFSGGAEKQGKLEPDPFAFLEEVA